MMQASLPKFHAVTLFGLCLFLCLDANFSYGQGDILLKIGDTFNIEPQNGVFWYNIRIEYSTKDSIVLDIVNVDRAEVYLDSLGRGKGLKPFVTEFRYNEAGREKHFIFAIPNAPPAHFLKVKTYFLKPPKRLKCRLICIAKRKMDIYTLQQFYGDRYINSFMVFMLGAFTLQIIYNIIQAFTRKRPEYWFLLLACVEYTRLHLVFFQYQLNLHLPAWLIYPNNTYISTCVFMVLYYMFFHFFYPQMKRVAQIGVAYLMVNLLAYFVLTLMNDLVFREKFVGYSLTSSYLLSLLLLYSLFSIKDATRYYFIIGTSLLIMVALLSRVSENIFGYGYYQVRLVAYLFDFMMLNAALNHRYQMEKREQQKRLENERNRIANDLHDDLGSGLSTIRLLGERAKMGIEAPEKKVQIQKIINQSGDLIDKMSTIIWAMNSRNDTVESLSTYLRRYAFEYLTDVHDLNVDFPLPVFPESSNTTMVSGEVRKEVFLCFKESLHNIVKHSKATGVSIRITMPKKSLHIEIEDYGIGFNPLNALGNGLKNMDARMKAIGGQFEIFGSSEGGTIVRFVVPINKS